MGLLIHICFTKRQKSYAFRYRGNYLPHKWMGVGVSQRYRVSATYVENYITSRGDKTIQNFHIRKFIRAGGGCCRPNYLQPKWLIFIWFTWLSYSLAELSIKVTDSYGRQMRSEHALHTDPEKDIKEKEQKIRDSCSPASRTESAGVVREEETSWLWTKGIRKVPEIWMSRLDERVNVWVKVNEW